MPLVSALALCALLVVGSGGKPSRPPVSEQLRDALRRAIRPLDDGAEVNARKGSHDDGAVSHGTGGAGQNILTIEGRGLRMG